MFSLQQNPWKIIVIEKNQLLISYIFFVQYLIGET